MIISSINNNPSAQPLRKVGQNPSFGTRYIIGNSSVNTLRPYVEEGNEGAIAFIEALRRESSEKINDPQVAIIKANLFDRSSHLNSPASDTWAFQVQAGSNSELGRDGFGNRKHLSTFVVIPSPLAKPEEAANEITRKVSSIFSANA